MKFRTAIIPALLIAAALSFHAEGRRARRAMPKPQQQSADYTAGSFTVSSDCAECHQGYTLSQVEFSGYDKPATSKTETLFISNGTDRTLTGVSFYIIYLATDGRQLHRRLVTLDLDIPAGTREMVSFKSWDLQTSYHYIKSRTTRRATTPYTIHIDPLTIRLSF